MLRFHWGWGLGVFLDKCGVYADSMVNALPEKASVLNMKTTTTTTTTTFASQGIVSKNGRQLGEACGTGSSNAGVFGNYENYETQEWKYDLGANWSTSPPPPPQIYIYIYIYINYHKLIMINYNRYYHKN